jgi:hypothetical protein
MTTFSSAAAAALKRPDDDLKPGLYSYVIKLELTVKRNGQSAPGIVAQILAKLVLDEPDIVVVDGTQQNISAADSLTAPNKTSLSPTSPTRRQSSMFYTSTSGGRLSCKLEIHSYKHSFHDIKAGAWELLQKHQVWFKQAPGPFKKSTLLAVGFWMNVYPGFASPSVFHTQIIQDIEEQYALHPEVIEKFRLPAQYAKVDIYLRVAKSMLNTRLEANPNPSILTL